MATHVRPTDPAVQRYREAEQRFWDHYGLVATEHVVPVGSPPTRLRVQEVGSGEPVVFVHGSGGSGACFAPLVRELDGFRCLLVDRPGWGLSDPVDFSAYDYHTAVTGLLRETLDGLGVAQARVVGGSLGAYWVHRLAQADPARVRRVVWLGGTALRGLDAPTFVKLLASPLGRLLVRAAGREAVLRKQMVALGHATTLGSGAMDAYLAWRAVEARELHPLRHERDMVRTLWTRRGWAPGIGLAEADFSGAPRPTLLVYGTGDPLGTADLWRSRIAQMSHGELALVPGGGHLPWYDDPGGVGDRVRRFLADR